ncbi:hypothetical protein F2P81_018573 [Scophthalmus maximus]|uniref:Uncharacterized protein n=1 Tax=Scophthalmus maximus TaxID=52904 RepID=A0A6A4SB23_SCOMX|nr:hypothetical protein F2P81_018573 [Scophthalmus maximus]
MSDGCAPGLASPITCQSQQHVWKDMDAFVFCQCTQTRPELDRKTCFVLDFISNVAASAPEKADPFRYRQWTQQPEISLSCSLIYAKDENQKKVNGDDYGDERGSVQGMNLTHIGKQIRFVCEKGRVSMRGIGLIIFEHQYYEIISIHPSIILFVVGLYAFISLDERTDITKQCVIFPTSHQDGGGRGRGRMQFMVLIHRPMMSSSSSHVCDEATDAHSRVVDVAVVALKNLKIEFIGPEGPAKSTVQHTVLSCVAVIRLEQGASCS